MADNLAITAGSGTTIATDQVGTVHYQKIKLIESTADSEAATGVTANPLAVALPSATVTTLTPPAAITGFALETGGNLAAVKTAVEVIDNIVSGSEAQVDVVAALPTGTNVIGAVKQDVVNWTPVHKFFTASYPSESTVWDPTGGTKFVVTDLLISASAAGSCIIKDGTGGTTLATLMFAANGGAVANLKTPWTSASADNNLTITPSAGTQYISVDGYEI